VIIVDGNNFIFIRQMAAAAKICNTVDLRDVA